MLHYAVLILTNLVDEQVLKNKEKTISQHTKKQIVFAKRRHQALFSI